MNRGRVLEVEDELLVLGRGIRRRSGRRRRRRRQGRTDILEPVRRLDAGRIGLLGAPVVIRARRRGRGPRAPGRAAREGGPAPGGCLRLRGRRPSSPGRRRAPGRRRGRARGTRPPERTPGAQPPSGRGARGRRPRDRESAPGSAAAKGTVSASRHRRRARAPAPPSAPLRPARPSRAELRPSGRGSRRCAEPPSAPPSPRRRSSGRAAIGRGCAGSPTSSGESSSAFWKTWAASSCAPALQQHRADEPVLHDRLVVLAGGAVEVGETDLDPEVGRIDRRHLLVHGDRVRNPVVLLVVIREHLVLAARVLDETLLVVEVGEAIVDLQPRRIDLVDLLVDRDRLEEEAVLRVEVGDALK